MVIAEMLTWWYTHGWRVFVQKLLGMFSNVADYFSMGSLARALFKPYRQISAEAAGDSASFDIRFHMFIDRLISRVVGFFSRLVLILVGAVIIVVGGTVGVILIVLWPVIPLLPVVGIVLATVGISV